MKLPRRNAKGRFVKGGAASKRKRKGTKRRRRG